MTLVQSTIISQGQGSSPQGYHPDIAYQMSRSFARIVSALSRSLLIEIQISKMVLMTLNFYVNLISRSQDLGHPSFLGNKMKLSKFSDEFQGHSLIKV